MFVLLLAIIGQMFDVFTTLLVLNAGGIEANPLLGSDPNMFLVLMVKLIVIAAIFHLLEGVAKMRVLTFATFIGFAAAGWNLYVFRTIMI